MEPQIKIIALSNVFTRVMHFVNVGDVESGHRHSYDHATLVSSGSVLYEVLDNINGDVVASKEVIAPNLVFVDKDKFHRITSLQPDTVCCCIHALRTIDNDILDSNFIINQIQSTNKGEIARLVQEKTGKPMMPFNKI
jgi:hypothetical protein